jgi:hypothetical protein
LFSCLLPLPFPLLANEKGARDGEDSPLPAAERRNMRR